MLRRLWLVLFCVLALAPLPLRAAAPAAGPWTGVQQGVTAETLPPAAITADDDGQPTAAADPAPFSSDVRGSERTELLTTLARVLATGAALPDDVGLRSSVAVPRTRQATGWCDVVQCRRWAGAQLLWYATPPPARA